MSHLGRSGPPDIRDTFSLLVLNITFRERLSPSFISFLFFSFFSVFVIFWFFFLDRHHRRWSVSVFWQVRKGRRYLHSQGSKVPLSAFCFYFYIFWLFLWFCFVDETVYESNGKVKALLGILFGRDWSKQSLFVKLHKCSFCLFLAFFNFTMS